MFNSCKIKYGDGIGEFRQVVATRKYGGIMFLRDLLYSCLRRWYFLVFGLVATLAATFMAYTTIQPTYEANASAVLIPPKVAVMVGDNPYLYLGGLDQALGVLQVKMASPDVLEPLTEKYQDSEVLVSKDVSTSGPIAAIKVSGPTAEQTMALLDETVALVPQTLTSLQQEQKVPVPSLITSMELSKDLEPTAVRKRQIQMTAVVFVGGASASLLLTGLLDRLLTGRKERGSARKLARQSRKNRTATPPADPTDEPADDESVQAPIQRAPEAELRPNGPPSSGLIDELNEADVRVRS